MKEKKRVKSPPLVFYTLFLISYFVSVLTNKQNLFSALFGAESRNMGLLTHLSILILLYVSIVGNPRIEKFLKFGLWPLIFINLLYGFIQLTGKDPIIWGEQDRIVLLLGNSNYAGQLLASLLVIPVAYSITKEHKVLKLFGFSVVLSSFYLGMMTQAFQFRVLAFINVLTFLIVYYWNWIKLNLRKCIVFLTSITFMMAIYSYLNWQKIDLIHRTNAVDRLDMSLVGLRILKDHFFFGIGIEQFKRFEPVYRGISQTLRNGDNVVPDKAHNVFIEHLANGGIFTGFFYILFITSTMFLVLKLTRTQISGSQRAELSILSSIWITYVVALFITTDVIFNMVLSYASLGLILKQAYVKSSSNSNNEIKKIVFPASFLTKPVLGVISAVTMLLSIQTVVNAYHWREIQTGKIREGNQILSVMGEMPRPKEAEKIIVSAFQNLQNCPFILQASERLIEMDSRSGQAYYFKAICEDYLGLTQKALNSINQAVMLQPLNTSYLESLTKLLYAVGNKEQSYITFQRLESINPANSKLNSIRNFIGLDGK